MPNDGIVNTSSASPPSGVPYVISPALRKKLQQCYEHGTKLQQQEKYDYDYAHSILTECVTGDPGNLVYVEAFLQNLQRKYNQNRRGSLLAFGGKGAFRKAVARKDWPVVFKLGPDILKSNPWDVSTLRGLAEACGAMGYHDVELRYLKNALEANPKDPEVNKHCALSLARIGQFDQAISCWQRIDEAKRGDADAQRMITDLQIAKTEARQGGGKPDPHRRGRMPVSPPPEPRETTPVTSSDTPRRPIELTHRQQLEQTIANNPTDIDTYLELAQLHVDEERLGEATHVLSKALAASGNNVKIQERLEDVELLRKRQQLTIAERRAETNNIAANQELVVQLRDDMNRIELEVFDRRAQRYPRDLELKYQLGLRLKRAGNVREAIAQFDQAQKLPARRTFAALEIGECLQRQKHYDKALSYYWIAAEEPATEKLELKKLALYRLGVLAEALKHLEDAERSLSQLVELDPQYKDAATRLDKIRLMRHKQP
jgi:tetratricopeptide (TPR) repeat protein